MKKRIATMLVVCILAVCMLPLQALAIDLHNVFEITGLSAPMDGATPDLDVEILQKDSCKVVSVRWMDLWTDSWISANDKFVYEKDEWGNERNYRVEIRVEIIDPTKIVSDDTLYATINGVDADVWKEDDTHAVLEMDFVPSKHTCTGGYATCIAAAKCGTCGKEYGQPNPENHNVYVYKKDAKHSKYKTHHDVKCEWCKKTLYEEAHSWGPENEDGVSPCAFCGYAPAVQTQTHTCSGGEATCTEKAICATCNKPYGEVDPDNHKYDNTYDYLVEDGHANICGLCNQMGQLEPHTISSDGTMCTACRYQFPVTVPDNTKPEQTPDDNQPQTGEENDQPKKLTRMLLIGVGIAGIGGGVTAGVVGVRRRRRVGKTTLKPDAADLEIMGKTTLKPGKTTLRPGKTTLDTAGKTTLDTAGKTTLDTAGKTTLDTAGKTTLDTAGKTTLDTAGKTTLDTAGKTTLDTAGKTTLDTAGKTTLDTAGKTTLKPGKTTLDEIGKTTLDSNSKTTL